MKNDDDILDIASSRIAALAVVSSSDGNVFFMACLLIENGRGSIAVRALTSLVEGLRFESDSMP